MGLLNENSGSDASACRGNAYGIDVCAGRTVIVKATRSRGRITHAVILDSTDREERDVVLASIAADTVAGGAVTACAMPAQNSFARWLQSPLKSRSKTLRVLPSLLDIQLPFPLESCLCNMVRLRRAPGGVFDALTVAARRQDISACINQLAAEKIDPMRLDHEGLALWTQSIRELPAERDSVRALVHVESQRALIVIGRGADFISAHNIRVGADDLVTSPAEAAANFSRRVRQILKAQIASFGQTPMLWAWSGSAAASETNIQALQSNLGDLGETKFACHKQPESLLARALAFRCFEDGGLPCNLRIEEFAHPLVARRIAARNMKASAAALVAGLLLFAMNISWRAYASARIRALDDAARRTAIEIVGSPHIQRGTEVVRATRAVEEQENAFVPFVQFFEPPITGLASGILETAQRHELQIENISIRPDSLSIRGTADDWNRCEALAQHLRDRDFTVEIERNDAGADERVPFAVRGVKRKEPAS